MIAAVDFARPWALLLLPLVVLPLLPRQREALAFSYVPWLPDDPWGRWAGVIWRALAVVAIASTVIALAGPGRAETEQTRTGHGAEILLLLDRSRSMDDRMRPSDWREIDTLNLRLQTMSRGPQKSQVARELLSKFVAERRNDRFALMFFSASPLSVVPFTQNDTAVQAAIAAGGVGRGLADTNVGHALIAAANEFNDRVYSGSRIILLISDGGAQLDAPTRQIITDTLSRNRVALYWIYLRALNGPKLDSQEEGAETVPEIALHRYFQTLLTPYRMYQAEDPEDLATAVADVGKQQNFPLDFTERIPRRDFSRITGMIALLSCAGLLLYRMFMLRGW